MVETLTVKYIFKKASIPTWYHGQALLLHGLTPLDYISYSAEAMHSPCRVRA